MNRILITVLLYLSFHAAMAGDPQVFNSRGTGYASSYAIDTAGNLWAWGNDAKGELGVGRITTRSTPASVDGLAKVIMINAGSSSSFAITQDSTLWAWGSNTYGQLGDGSGVDRTTPTKVGTGFKVVDSGAFHTLALKTDGSLWAWGYNGSGQLGDGSKTDIKSPVKIGDGFSAIAAGVASSFALKADGTLWAWGENANGCLGDGTRTSRLVPVMIGDGYANIRVTKMFYCIALATKLDGSTWIWGQEENSAGSSSSSYIDLLADSIRADVLTPAKLDGNRYLDFAMPANYLYGLKADGSLWSLRNYYKLTPYQIGIGYLKITERGAAISATGNLVEFSGNDYDFGTPVVLGSGYTAVSAGFMHTIALKSDGSVWTWGSNQSGQLGIDQPLTRSIPYLVGTGYSTLATYGGLLSGTDVYAVKTDGSLWHWGSFANGVPTQLGSGYAKVAVGADHVLALKRDGSLWAWGFNGCGQIGDGTTTTRSASDPYLVGNNFSDVAAEANISYAVKSDKTVWAWGLNSYGQLGYATTETCGDGTHAASRTARQITTLQSIRKVSLGPGHALALAVDGTLWAWGSNNVGQLGDGTTSNRSLPGIVGTGYADISAAAATVSTGSSYAVKQDGTLWTWGGSQWDVAASLPRQIGTGFSLVAAGGSHVVALKSDGSVWSWGMNRYGELGDGTYGLRRDPVLVVNDTLTGFLDMNPAIVKNIPGAAVPQFLVKAKSNANINALSLSVDVRGLLNFAGSRSAIRAGSYNLYVAALAGAGGALNWYQFDTNKQWQALAWPMAAFMTGVSLSSSTDSVIVDILEGANVSSLAGSHIYVGYGTSAEEMVSAGRYREIMTIPVQ